jgi:hypothetical protein
VLGVEAGACACFGITHVAGCGVLRSRDCCGSIIFCSFDAALPLAELPLWALWTHLCQTAVGKNGSSMAALEVKQNVYRQRP